MKKLMPYRKCIVSGVGTFFAWMAKCTPDGISASEMWQIAGATVVATVTVYLFPNGEKAKSIRT